MANKEAAEQVEKNLDKQIRRARHGVGYYLSIAILAFAIPAYVLSKSFDPAASTWRLFDLFIIGGLLVLSVYMLYRDRSPDAKMPMWFKVIGVISVIAVTLLQIVLPR